MLYLIGFDQAKAFVGGYSLVVPIEEALFGAQVVTVCRFFEKAHTEGSVRFHPEKLQTEYEEHRGNGRLWQRIL